NGHEAIVKLLLAKDSVSLNSKNANFGLIPLTWAIQDAREGVVKLPKAEADINVMDYYGRTALSSAAKKGHVAVVKLLLEAKADVNVKDNNGRTPLSGAAEKWHVAVVKLLLETKADINVKDKWGRTALSRAADKRRVVVVKLLLK